MAISWTSFTLVTQKPIGRDTGDGSRRSPCSRNSPYDTAKGSGQYYAPVNFTKYPDTETPATEEK